MAAGSQDDKATSYVFLWNQGKASGFDCEERLQIPADAAYLRPEGVPGKRDLTDCNAEFRESRDRPCSMASEPTDDQRILGS